MATDIPPPQERHDFEGDYRPANPGNPSALLDPMNIRVEPADLAYLMQIADALNNTLDLQTLLKPHLRTGADGHSIQNLRHSSAQ